MKKRYLKELARKQFIFSLAGVLFFVLANKVFGEKTIAVFSSVIVFLLFMIIRAEKKNFSVLSAGVVFSVSVGIFLAIYGSVILGILFSLFVYMSVFAFISDNLEYRFSQGILKKMFLLSLLQFIILSGLAGFLVF